MPSFGYKAQVGIAKEASYDSAETPTDFFEITGEDVRADAVFGESEGISPNGRNFPVARQHVLRRWNTLGSLRLEQPLEDAGKLIEGVLGKVTSAQQGVTPAYLHTFVPTDTLPSYTLEIGRDARAFTYSGVKIRSWTFEASASANFVTSTFEVVGSGTWTDSATVTSPTFSAANRLFHPEIGKLEIDGAEVNARRFRFTVTNEFNDGDASYGFSPVRKRLDEMDIRTVEGEMELAFDDMTEVDKIASETASKLEFTLTGDEIDTGENQLFAVTIEEAKYLGDAPQVRSRRDEIILTLRWRAVYDGSNPVIKVEIENTEAVISAA